MKHFFKTPLKQYFLLPIQFSAAFNLLQNALSHWQQSPCCSQNARRISTCCHVQRQSAAENAIATAFTHIGVSAQLVRTCVPSCKK
jgi:hypothetical protein